MRSPFTPAPRRLAENPARRRFSLGSAAALALAVAGPVRAQPAWPARPISLIVPVPPGSVMDSMARALGANVAAALKQPVVIENRPGASATMSASIVARAAPDGYTLGVAPASILKLPHLQRVSWDPIRDLSYLLAFTRIPYALVVHRDSPWKSVQDLVAYGKANPGKLTIGATAHGSSGHIAIASFARQAGIEVTFVAFKGGVEEVQALGGRHVDAILDGSWAQVEQQSPGRVLMCVSEQRIGRLPDVPTAREAGFDVVIRSPLGIVAPKGIDADLARVIHDAFKAALADPGYRRVLQQNDYEDAYVDGPEYARLAQQLFVEEKANLDALGIRGQ